MNESKIEQFSQNFLNEVFKLVFLKKDVCEIVVNNLSYDLIPVDLKGYKIILKKVADYFNSTHKLPTVGIIVQDNQVPEVWEAISKIQQTQIPDKEVIIPALESFIKRVMFQKLYYDISEIYNQDRKEEAIEKLYKDSEKIVNFSLFSKSSYFEDVFEGFFERDNLRSILFQEGKQNTNKVTFGIDALDEISEGGLDPGDIDCFLGRSGTGKTKWLRYRGISSARRGKRVLHVQLEGTKEKCLEGYDSTWTAILKRDLLSGNIDADLQVKIRKIISDIRNKNGNVKVIAFEQFNMVTMKDVRNAILDYYKIEGCYPEHLILDYLELIHPGDGRKYSPTTEGEKYKREASARAFKNVCMEFGMVGSTASQANDIAPDNFNNISWVMTRHNVAGAKGLIDPFSFFFTWNVSMDEYKNKMGRLYCDKVRDYESQQIIKICTAFHRDRFYDRVRTIEMGEENE